MKAPSSIIKRRRSDLQADRSPGGFSNSSGAPFPDDAIEHIYSLMDTDQVSEAFAVCRRMLAIHSDRVDLLFVMAVLQQRLGKPDEAISAYRRIIGMEPARFEAAFNLGLLYHQRGESNAAERCYRQALHYNPDFTPGHNNLGGLLLERGELSAAAQCFEKVCRSQCQKADGYFNLGRCRHEQGRFEEAVDCFRKTVALKPEGARGWRHLGLSCQKLGLYEKALSHLKTALGLSPGKSDLYFDIGNVYLDLQDMVSVIEWYRLGVTYCPENIDRLQNLATLLQERGLFREAVECYRKIIAMDPDHGDAHFDLSLLLLRYGNYEEGWREYEWRLRQPKWSKFFPAVAHRPLWKGEEFRGKTLLVHCEQGFGDSIQFARYLPMVKARGGEVILEAPGPLMSLFQGLPGVDRLRRLTPGSPPAVDFDVYAPLLSLPGIFQTRPTSIPGKVPYLFADPAKMSRWQHDGTRDKCKIGIVWAGSKVHVNDRKRSCPLEHFKGLAGIPHLQFFSLQTETASAEIESCGFSDTIIHWGDQLNDFSDTAAAISSLDLLITVDTAAAHLAGAMGHRVWLLLPYVSDWRWFTDRCDSPWYPSMRLFRQRAPGDWPSVFEQVTEALHRFLDHLSSDHEDDA
jgi:tetratricopeptide (TPR) repeat protein